jgi:hypothetical protein
MAKTDYQKMKDGYTPKGKPSPTQRFNDVWFVQRELSDDERKYLKANKPTADDLMDNATRFCQAGYKLTVRWDDDRECLSVTAFPEEGKTTNGGCALTGRGSRLFSALAELLFKHFHVFDTVWPKRSEKVFSDWED